VSDYEWQVKLAAKGLAERDNHPMPKSVTKPEAFYEVMAAAALDAIDLPALLERVTRAERELEIIQEALRRADTEVKNARHKPMTDGRASEESSIAAILRGASTSREATRTHNPRQSPLPTDPEHIDGLHEQRRSSMVPPPRNHSGQVRLPPPHRRIRGFRRALTNHFHSLSWRKLLPLRSPSRKVATKGPWLPDGGRAPAARKRDEIRDRRSASVAREGTRRVPLPSRVTSAL
jgi:hypothetical protein